MRWTSLVAFLVFGCSPASLSGTIDGDHVGGARDAFYDTVRVEMGQFEFETTTILLTDYPDGCEVIDDYFDAYEFDCDDWCDNVVAVTDEWGFRGDAYWHLTLTLNTSDGVEGEFDWDDEFGDGEFVATFSEYDATPLQDHALCEEECEDLDLLVSDDEEAEGGTVEITRDDGDLISGRFELDMGGDDGMKGGFDARPCDMDEWLQ